MNWARFVAGFLLAALHLVLFDPLVLAAAVALTGHWQLGAVIAAGWFVLCAVAVSCGVMRLSPMTLEEVFTAPLWLRWLGDDEQGWLPSFLVAKWPRWVPHWFIAWSCCAWRNKLRNIAFWPPLAWLHKPKGELREHVWLRGKLGLRMRTRGWMTEIEYWYGTRFGDFGPRLDFPDQWGGVTWAFRPWGKGK